MEAKVFFVNATKTYQFKAKNYKTSEYALCLCHISKYLTINNMEKSGLGEVLKLSSVDFNPIDTNNILDIHNYLIKRTWYKTVFGLIKKIFIGLWTDLVNGSTYKVRFVRFVKQSKMYDSVYSY